MAAEPIYPDQLNFALDRLFARVTGFVNARFDEVMTQMRIDKQQTQAAIQQTQAAIQQTQAAIQQTQTELREFRQETRAQIEALGKRVTDVEDYQKTMTEASRAQTEDILQVVRTLHAEAMEGINELRQKGKE